MSSSVYPLFRDYSLSVREWLRKVIYIPRLDRIQYGISKLTRTGTAGGGVNQHEIHLITAPVDIKTGHPIRIEGSVANNDYFLVEKIVGNIIVLNINYKKLSADQAVAGGIVKRCVNIIYASMEKAISDVAQPLRNGMIDSPGIAFYISDHAYKPEKSRPKESYYTRRYTDADGNVTGTAAVPPLLEYQVQYSINIWATWQQELDILINQIITEFVPDKFFWIGDQSYGFDYQGDRMDREHHGQWAHAQMDSFQDASDLEPGGPDRSLRAEIGFTITNAYIPQAFNDDHPYIGSIDVETVLEDRITRC